MIKHNATRILTSKGWTVAEACERWCIRIATYNARCNNLNLTLQLEDMCNGLKSKVK
jgi:hypothetical protein